VFAHDDETWVEALTSALRGRTVACVEIGTAGALAEVIGEAPWFLYDEVVASGGRAGPRDRSVRAAARRVRLAAGTEVGLAVRARERAKDTDVAIALAMGATTSVEKRVVFLRGSTGRRRAALAACAILWTTLREGGPGEQP
jgi:hypothetical protein